MACILVIGLGNRNRKCVPALMVARPGQWAWASCAGPNGLGIGSALVPLIMSGANRKLPTREQIEQRAYQRYLKRGCQKGDDLADWLAAETELLHSLNSYDEPVQAFSSFGQQGGRSATMLDFFGLRQQPFGMTPDPAYLYASKTHSEALASLSLGIADTRGFLALIAEPGMGKTTLLYQLLEQLRDSARTVLLFQSECTSREFIEYIVHDLGVDVKGLSLVAMHGKLNEILFEELLKGKRFVLVVDEAQNLDDSVLETVRMLSNFETHNAKLLQIILAGQPRLAAKLAQPRLSQLRQRISILTHLEPFNVEETRRYIEHRLRVAGHRGEPIFEIASIRLIAGHSKGIPRNINNLCYHSLLLSQARGHRTVTPEIVQAAVGRLDMESLAHEPLAVADSGAIPPVVRAEAAAAAVTRTPPPPAPTAPNPPVVPSAPNASGVRIVKVRSMKSSLTYDAGEKVSQAGWPIRSVILAITLLSGTLLLAILLGRAESTQRLTPEIFNHSSSELGGVLPADQSSGPAATYDATPQDTGNGLVLTVVAGPQQTLKDLSLRYLGRFDSELFDQIRSLNPGLADPDHLEAGQLVRIPLPPGALKKANDTAEAAASPKPETSTGLFTRFTALLRERK